MSTTMLNHNRRFIRPSKRKDRDGFDALKLSTTTKLAKPSLPEAGSPSAPKRTEPAPSSSNQLLAGYLANEFLSKGTLFGQKWDPARAQAEPIKKAEPKMEKHERYVEVADILKNDGAHLPGVINPTQLGRFLKL